MRFSCGHEADPDERPYSPLENCVLDAEIGPLVRALNSNATVTATSCSGHGEDPANVSFYLWCGYVRRFTELLDDAHRALRRRVCMDLDVVWCLEIAGVPYGDDLPDWLLVSLSISRERERPPTAKQLDALVAFFKKKLPGSGRPLRGPVFVHVDGCSGHWVGVDLEKGVIS
jgi:hypothetical protein